MNDAQQAVLAALVAAVEDGADDEAARLAGLLDDPARAARIVGAWHPLGTLDGPAPG